MQRQHGRRAAPASGAITLQQLRSGAARFGVTTVRAGTLDDQVDFIGRSTEVGRELQARVAAQPSIWAAWDPGSSSEVYRWVLDGLEDFAGAFGGTPPIDSIFFFLTSWEMGRSGLQWGPGAAEYGAGKMAVYQRIVQDAPHKVLPVARDQTGGGAASLPDATPEEGARRIVTHELGHGLAEAAAGQQGTGIDPQIVRDYGRSVGWFHEQLYDIGVAEVADAIGRGKQPPDRYHIKPDNWQRGWEEQPISQYQVEHGPFEDLPEAIMAYTRSPQVLRDRSPHRFHFVESRHQMLQQANTLRPPDAATAAGTPRP